MSVYSQFQPDWVSDEDCPCAIAGEFDPTCTRRDCQERENRRNNVHLSKRHSGE
jgi:hypothetical protein